MKTTIFTLLILVLCTQISLSQDDLFEEVKVQYPKDGYVPDDSTAIKLAKLILFPIYGERISKTPFTCKLVNDSIWLVEGNYLRSRIKKGELMSGGEPYIWINKRTGEILKHTHTR